MSFLEARIIVGTYMAKNSYAFVAWRPDTINQDNRIRALEEKLIQLEPNDSPKFQEQLKNLISAEFQTQPRPISVNKEKVGETTKVKSPTNQATNQQTNPTAPAHTTTSKRKSHAKLNPHRSPIRPPSYKLDNLNL